MRLINNITGVGINRRGITGDPRAIPGTVEYEANLKAVRQKFGSDPRYVPGTPQYEAELKAIKAIQNSAAAVPVAVETPAPVQTVETWRGINKKWIYFAAGAVAFWLLWGRR